MQFFSTRSGPYPTLIELSRNPGTGKKSYKHLPFACASGSLLRAGVIAQAFPRPGLWHPSEADMMNTQFFGKLSTGKRHRRQNVCRVSAKIESLKENCFELEGQKFEISPTSWAT